jgi:hypothetical protein
MTAMLNKKYRGFIQGLLLLLIVVFAVWKFFPGAGAGEDNCTLPARLPVDELVYVNHARCRMDCRDIDEALVEDVYLHGEINCKKSSINNGNHRYALEKRDQSGDMIRIILEDDHGKHVIVTAIRLDRKDRCECS